MKQRYVTRHSTVEGRRLVFDGTGGQLFGTWLKIFFLTIITLGIYSFWAELTMTRWVIFHTRFDNGWAQPQIPSPEGI
jgi:uncharacterized membrane protein YjgN (DUF898 family)